MIDELELTYLVDRIQYISINNVFSDQNKVFWCTLLTGIRSTTCLTVDKLSFKILAQVVPLKKKIVCADLPNKQEVDVSFKTFANIIFIYYDEMEKSIT